MGAGDGILANCLPERTSRWPLVSAAEARAWARRNGYGQFTQVAESNDGLHFEIRAPITKESPCADRHRCDLESRFAAFCRDVGIEFMSLTDPMRRAPADGRLFYAPEDSHWNAAGHGFVAQQVASVWASMPGRSAGADRLRK